MVKTKPKRKGRSIPGEWEDVREQTHRCRGDHCREGSCERHEEGASGVVEAAMVGLAFEGRKGTGLNGETVRGGQTSGTVSFKVKNRCTREGWIGPKKGLRD